MRGLWLSLPLLVTSREFPPGPAQPLGLTKQAGASDAPHGGAARNGQRLSCRRAVAAAWAGPLCSGRGQGQGPPRNCPPRWKVTGKCRGNRPRARRAPATGTNATLFPPRAAPTPAPAGSWTVWTRRPGTETKHIGQNWLELPPKRCPRLLSDPRLSHQQDLSASFPREKLRFREVRGQIRTRRGLRILPV